MDNSDDRREVGRAVWDGPDGGESAIFYSDGTWETPHAPDWAMFVTGMFADSLAEAGEQDGYPGVREIEALAKLMGGRAVIQPPRYPFPPDNPEASIVGPVLDYLKVRRPPEG